MEFVATARLDMPQAASFAGLCDPARFETLAKARGAALRRRSGEGPIEAGSSWDLSFDLNGKQLDIRLQIMRLLPPKSILLAGHATQLEGQAQLVLTALSENQTGVTFTLSLTPKSLSARLMLQPLKLAHNQISDRLAARVAAVAKDVEAEYRAQHGSGGS